MMREQSEYHFICVCGHGIVSHLPAGICPKCEREFEIRREALKEKEDRNNEQ